ncbi:AMP-binding protein [Shewanella sp. AS16]|uniref:olefin beta-lactone synthetase n=1 Tax=Shewanella sp. AS16 TaxID=2907625 RepID=UPI001EED221E|nr:fatty acid CoA ligase family protein [Shewanella sp. AS16]MCE9685023.1 AMP-binding protein [Shewanella sp. AS16]
MTAAQVAMANLCRHLSLAARATPTQLAVAVQQSRGGKLVYAEIDFAELDKRSDAIAFALNHAGIGKGRKAVLMVTPSLDFFAFTFALFKAGIIPILVDPGMGIRNLKQCFAEAEPDVFIGIPKAHVARRLFAWGKPSVRHCIHVGGNRLSRSLTGAIGLDSLLAQAPETSEPYPMVMLPQDEMAAILFTSGSTGTPKGVVYSHGMFEAQIQVLKTDYGIRPGERDLATFPLFSLFGPALGMAAIVPEMDASKPITANPEFIFAAIEKYQCTNLFVNPALVERLGQALVVGDDAAAPARKLPSLRRVISAGAPATIASIARFANLLGARVPLLNSYGATESLPISMIASQELLTTSAITDAGGGICVGTPVSGVDIKIIGITEDVIGHWDEARVLAAGEIGEIVVRGPMVSQGYYRRDGASAAAKIADTGGRLRHRMGDLGYLDQEGKLWMCGRKAHRVDAGRDGRLSKRYFSIPCERIFNTHGAVKRSALVGVKLAGEVTPLVCLELAQGLACNKGGALYAELRALAEQYPHTRGISRFLIHPEFPVDIRHNAKIFREKLALWAQSQLKE